VATVRGIEVRGLRHAYRGRPRLGFPDFVAGPGELVWLHGASGSGKSTLIHLLCGVLTPQPTAESTLRLCGRDLLAGGSAARASLRPWPVGWVPQRTHLLGRLSAFENVVLPSAFGKAGVSSRTVEIAGRARRLLERLGLADIHAQRGDALSAGQAARVAVARALVLEPEVIVADEPTAALDAESARLVADCLAERLAAGATVVIASHDPAWVEGLASRAPGGQQPIALGCPPV